MRTAGIGYASYFFTLQRIRKKLPVAGSAGEWREIWGGTVRKFDTTENA